MKLVKHFAIAIVMLLAGSLSAAAQNVTPAPPPAPNDGTHIDLSLAYQFVNNTPTVNGSDSQSATVATLRVPFSDGSGRRPGLAGVLKAIVLPGQNANVILGGVEARWNSSALLSSSSLRFDPKKYDLFTYAALGGKRQDASNVAAFSYIVGGGIDYKLTSNVVLRAIDIAYFKSNLQSKGVILSDHMQFAPGIALRF